MANVNVHEHYPEEGWRSLPTFFVEVLASTGAFRAFFMSAKEVQMALELFATKNIKATAYMRKVNTAIYTPVSDRSLRVVARFNKRSVNS